MLDKNKFKCDKCGRLDFDNQTNFTRHTNSCTGKKPKKRKSQSAPVPKKQTINHLFTIKRPRNDSIVINSIVEKLVEDVCLTPTVDSQASASPIIETIDLDRIPEVNLQADVDFDRISAAADIIETVIQEGDSEVIEEQQQSNTKCAGYRPRVTQLYHNFPFQLLEDKNYLVFEAGVFHSKECYNQSYTLHESEHNANKSCSDLKDDRFVKAYTEPSHETETKTN